MITAKERKQRQAMRILRIEVLDAIDKLDGERCDSCRGNMIKNAPINIIRCGCAASVKIRKMGNLL